MVNQVCPTGVDWNSYGLDSAYHRDADMVLNVLKDLKASPEVIAIASKEAVWQLTELPTRSKSFQKSYLNS